MAYTIVYYGADLRMRLLWLETAREATHVLARLECEHIDIAFIRRSDGPVIDQTTLAAEATREGECH